MAQRQSTRREQRELTASLRAEGRTWAEIADVVASRYRLNRRVAMRLAHGWSQRDAMEAWNRRWPKELKAAKNFSYWETWPISGRTPSLDVLDQLAQLYECSIADLLADVGDYRHLDTNTPAGDEAAPTALHRASATVLPLPPAPDTTTGWPTNADVGGLEAVELLRRIEATDAGPATLAAIESGVDRLSRAYTHVAPAELIVSLRSFQRYVTRLLDGRATLAQRRELMRHAGWLSLLAATADIDLGDDRAAATDFDLARRLAVETGDASLGAWALETRAWQALSGGDAAHAATLCRQGLDLVRAGTSPHVQLSTQLARVSARLGDRATTRRLADAAVEAATDLPSTQAEHHFVCDRRRAIAYCAAALVWAGEADGAAEEYARHAVTQYEADREASAHRLATARLNLALLLARTGQPTEATHLGHLALGAAWRLCQTDLFLAEDLDRRLRQRYRNLADVAAYHDRYLELRHTIRTRQPV